MNDNYNPALVRYARDLRNNPTKEERKLWYEFLRFLPVRFYRQKIVEKYILDFYCPAKKIAIELDGSQHYEENNEKADRERDKFMMQRGIVVLRYSNLELLSNFKAVCLDIEKHIGE